MQHNLEIARPSALEGWESIVGAEGVKSDDHTLTQYARNCGPQPHRPVLVLYPRSTEEVQRIMRRAQSEQIAVYPISRGRNSGYGSATPSAENCIILDLRCMNKIQQVHEGLAYAVIEPGVTQFQLYEYLKNSGSRLWMDSTGATPDSSIIGNLVERGYGLSPNSDRFMNSCGMEVVLPTGELLNTGFGHISGTRVAHLHKWGIGPYLDGLFTQGNFGIVTKIGIWLMPKPEHSEIVSILFPDDTALLNSIERLRNIKLAGLFPGAVHIANDMRVISVLQQYPFAEMQNATPLSPEMLERLKQRWQVGAWNCIAGMWGTRSHVKSMRRSLKAALRGIVSPKFISQKLVNWLVVRRWLHWLPGVKNLTAKIGLLKLLEGVPSVAPQLGAYWRKRASPPLGSVDVERDNCGLVWIAPIVPSTREDLARFITITRSLCTEFRFETNIAVSLLSDRACCCTVAIVFDRDIPTETERAERCQGALLRQYLEGGFPPYRAGSDWSELIDLVVPSTGMFRTVCRKLKHAFDPAGVLAPNRYGIS